jgi:hypothetical protein
VAKSDFCREKMTNSDLNLKKRTIIDTLISNNGHALLDKKRTVDIMNELRATPVPSKIRRR